MPALGRDASDLPLAHPVNVYAQGSRESRVSAERLNELFMIHGRNHMPIWNDRSSGIMPIRHFLSSAV